MAIQVQYETSNTRCFSISQQRMIPKGEFSIVAEPSNKFLGCFLKCCSRQTEAEQNNQAIHMYEQYLETNYGKLSAQFAWQILNINLTQRKDLGMPLYNIEAQAIQRKAEELKGHLRILKKMLKHITFYEASQQLTGDTLSARDSAITLVKKHNCEADFQSEKIKRDLETLPLQRPLDKRNCQLLILKIKKDCEHRHVSSDEIRLLIVQALSIVDNSILRPEIYDYLCDAPELQSIKHKKHLEELSPKEIELLIEQSDAYNEFLVAHAQRIAQPTGMMETAP